MFAATVVFFRNRSEDFSAGAFPQRIRSRTHFPAEGYRPHFAPSVDYSALRPGTEFWIMEGGTAVGEGVIIANGHPSAKQAT